MVFVKLGTVNFNAYHGCLKCHVIGEYDNDQRNMSFPRTDMPRRTDDTFRQQLDKDHHKFDSPLLSLPIDMVDDIVVCDMLHQLHVGIMKKLLLCFTGQVRKMGFYSRWDHYRIKQVSQFLIKCNMPSDINRAVRPLDCLAFWKATEFRTFLHYIGPVILRDFLPHDAYEHFLAFFCAVTICSSSKYLPYIDAAELLLKNFIEIYINIYGHHTIGTNVHNLCHLTEEVKRFGPLPTFSTYPFENKLFQIKRMLRTGSKPLVQIAKRLAEYNNINDTYKPAKIKKYPVVYCKTYATSDIVQNDSILYKKIEVNKAISLCSNDKNKWFYTMDGQIVAMKFAVAFGNTTAIVGNSLISKRDFFTQPMLSSSLNIFISNGETKNDSLYKLDQITAKFVCLTYKTEFVFIPLLHTL